MPLTSLGGNHPLKEQLLPRLSAGNLGHAYILAGPAGSGKGTLAAILAKAMVCSGSGIRPCGSCPACKKAAAGIHPDISSIAPVEEGKPITVDQVRALRADAYIRPNEAPRKVYVLQQADRLNPNAQNAMLKLLEEGPAYAAFLLLTEQPGALLATVRSRCETLTLAPPSAQKEQEEDGQTAQILEYWLNGNEQALMERCLPMETWDRNQFQSFLDRMTGQLTAMLPAARDRRRVLKGVQLAARLRAALALNTGVGHLVGWLCAAACDETKF